MRDECPHLWVEGRCEHCGYTPSAAMVVYLDEKVARLEAEITRMKLDRTTEHNRLADRIRTLLREIERETP